MTEADDLIERLLAMYSHRCDGLPTQYVNPDGPEAAARIATQQEAIDELVAGIERAKRHAMNVGIDSGSYVEMLDALLSKHGERT